MPLKLSDFDLPIPDKLIAQYPVQQRDQCRLLVLDRVRQKWQHEQFFNLVEHINPGDVLVLNDTKVFPARLIGRHSDLDLSVEVFLTRELEQDKWEALIKPARKVPPGSTIIFDNDTTCKVHSISTGGVRVLSFSRQGVDFQQFLEQVGRSPLPPYIDREAEPDDRQNYQTVYARQRGAVAAPTAGLHFTSDLLKTLEDQGTKLVYLTHHVGLGTFQPVRVDLIDEHKMGAENFSISVAAASEINAAAGRGSRVIAVGTTVTRALETQAVANRQVVPGEGSTEKFIYPPYEFKIVDALVTNFHQPKSTLIMLVSAFAGRELIMTSYKAAVSEGYRFFSYGDAMFIV